MLDFASRSEFLPGSNLRGEQVDAAWLYLLPRLDVGRALLVGLPSAGLLLGLSALGSELVVQPYSARVERSLKRVLARNHLSAATRRGPLRPSGDAFDLVYLTAGVVPAVVADDAALTALRQVVVRDGCVYVEPSPALGRLTDRLEVGAGVVLAARTPSGREDGAGKAWLVPCTPLRRRRGRAAARAVARRLPRALVPQSIVRATATEQGSGALQPVALSGSEWLATARSAHHGMLLNAPASARCVPAYLRRLAEQAGHPLPEGSWSILAPRGYRSQKTIFFVSSDGPDRDVVVKLTQDPAFNARLDNERRALDTLDRRNLTDAAGAPRLLFWGSHAGLSIVAQTRTAGVPFVGRSSGEADCPLAAAAIDRLTALAVASAHQIEGDGLVAATGRLVDAFIALYRPGKQEVRLLRGAWRDLASSDVQTAVVMHGDPTPLNLLTDTDGSVSMVDWENAEASGPPLWDLFYFVFTYTTRSARRRGHAGYVDAFERDLLGPSPFRDLLDAAVRRYRERVGIPAAAVDALFMMCWTYLALRQARQLSRRNLRRAHFARTLQVALEHRARVGGLPWGSMV